MTGSPIFWRPGDRITNGTRTYTLKKRVQGAWWVGPYRDDFDTILNDFELEGYRKID